MDCLNFHENLYFFLDQAADENLKTEMEQHAASCPLCSLDLEKERAFGGILKSHLIRENAPYALKESLVTQLEIRKQRVFRFDFSSIRLAWAIPVIMSVLIVMFSLKVIIPSPFPVFAEVTAKHLEYLKGVYPLEFKTGDINTALDWFKGKTDFNVAAPHIALNKVNVVGGRMINLKDKKTAYILMEKDGYKISCFYTDLKDEKRPTLSVMEGINALDSHRLVKSQNGYNTVFCYHPTDGTACIFVSDMPLDQFTKLFV